MLMKVVCVKCKHALGAMQNAVFMIDLDKVHFNDLKADDLGSWRATGINKLIFISRKAKIAVQYF